MREIKFRGKLQNGYKEWVYFDMYKFCTDEYESKNLFEQYRVDTETIGQFTGLKDIKGIEIYEGDLGYDGEAIVWCDNCHGWQVGSYDTSEKCFFISCNNCEGNFMLEDVLSYFEVIGNIHEGVKK